MERWLYCVLLILLPLGCAPPDDLTAADVAKAFGLSDGRELSYEVTNATWSSEDHAYAKSSSYAEKLVYTRTERTQGFVRQEADGTAAVYDLEVTLEGVQLLAHGDGSPRLIDYAEPIVMVAHPITAGDKQETETTAEIHEGAGVSEQSERHLFTVGSEGTVSSGAGELKAYSITWQRWIDGGDAETSTLYWAVDGELTGDKKFVGIVGIDRPDGESLRLTELD